MIAKSKRIYLLASALILAGSLSYSADTFISDWGTEDIVDYGKYGSFDGVDTENYRYIISDYEGLGRAQGEGIAPNTWSLDKNPRFTKDKEAGLLDGNRWDFVNVDNKELAFFKWASSYEEHPGLRQFYVASALEKAGHIKQAIKAYYTVVVMFPRTIGRTYWHNPWYVGQVALDKIKFLCAYHPEEKIAIEGAFIKIKNRFDNDISNDIFIVNPGKLVNVDKQVTPAKININALHKVKENIFGDIKLVQYDNKHWQLFINDRLWQIRGMGYLPSVIGQSPDKGTFKDWMQSDINKNGRVDCPFDTWVDLNQNDVQDNNEQVVGDFKLMHDMGVNTLRVYHHASNKKLLRELYNKYGIMVMLGDFLGMYATGSGADWFQGTDYTNPKHCKNMMASVLKMVREHKDEPYVLMWILGNENNYGTVGIKKQSTGSGCMAGEQPEQFYKFVNKVAKKIKEIDPNHPIAICNGDVLFLDVFAKNSDNIDIFGCNAYRGMEGFGSTFWEDLQGEINKPVLVTEYGCPAFYWGKSQKEAEHYQRLYHQFAWEDIINNMAGKGKGIALGGVVFEWVDGWWKAFYPYYHDRTGQWAGPFPDGWMYEEWLGICSQGKGKNSPFLRQIRESYYYYKSVWNDQETNVQ
ncbi:MAG: glycoside hydrolase family 2 TIM barrel-domain containing protein [Elusimicrobiota bacterium]